jgi:p-aminobenzoyl-glutamate transporter AbgT
MLTKCDLYPELKDRIKLKEVETWYYNLLTSVSLCLAAVFLLCLCVETVFKKRDRQLLVSSLNKYKVEQEKEMEATADEESLPSASSLQ